MIYFSSGRVCTTEKKHMQKNKIGAMEVFGDRRMGNLNESKKKTIKTQKNKDKSKKKKK